MKNTIERRQSTRVNVSFPIECKCLPSCGHFCTVSKDLSLVGVKIITDRSLSKGNKLQIDINLIDHILNLKARVAWCNAERSSERYSAGLEFVEINKIAKEKLSSFINKVYNS